MKRCHFREEAEANTGGYTADRSISLKKKDKNLRENLAYFRTKDAVFSTKCASF